MAASTKSDVTASLFDPATSEVYNIIISADDAKRAGEDLVFATQLFNQAKLQAAVSAKQSADTRAPLALAATGVTENVRSKSTLAVATPHFYSDNVESGSSATEPVIDETADNSDEKDHGTCSWTKPMVVLLIRTYQKTESSFTNGKMSQKRAWEQSVSKVMSDKGYQISGSKCASKLSSLKRTYKTVKDHNNRSGNERRNWYFLDILDELFENRPWIKPVATASSDCIESDSVTSDQPSETNSSSHRQTTTAKQKKSKYDIMERLIEEKRKYREAKQVQHEEKIREARRLSDILTKLLATKSKFPERTSDFDEYDNSD